MASPSSTQPAVAMLQWPSEILDTPLTIDDLWDINISLTPFSVYWYDIGFNLGVPNYRLAIIDKDNPLDTPRKLIQMIDAWLSSGKNSTRRALLEVLQRRGYLQLANTTAVTSTLEPVEILQERTPNHNDNANNVDIKLRFFILHKTFLTLVSKLTFKKISLLAYANVKMSHLGTVTAYFSRYRAQWQAIGKHLGMSQEELDVMMEENDNDEDKIEKITIKRLIDAPHKMATLFKVVQECFPNETSFTITIQPTELVIEHKNSEKMSARELWNSKCELNSILQLLQILATSDIPSEYLRFNLRIPAHISDQVMEKTIKSYISENITCGNTSKILSNSVAIFCQNQVPMVILSKILVVEDFLSKLSVGDITFKTDLRNAEKDSAGRSTPETEIHRIRDNYQRLLHNNLKNCVTSIDESLKQAKSIEFMTTTYNRINFSFGMITFLHIILVYSFVLNALLNPVRSVLVVVFLFLVLWIVKYCCGFQLPVRFHFRLDQWVKLTLRHYGLSIILLGTASAYLGTRVDDAIGMPSGISMVNALLLKWIKHINQTPDVTTITIGVILNALMIFVFQIFLGFLIVTLYRRIKKAIDSQQSLTLLVLILVVLILLFKAAVLTYTIIVWALVGTAIFTTLSTYKDIILPWICTRGTILILSFHMLWHLGNYLSNYTISSFFSVVYWISIAAYISWFYKSPWTIYTHINNYTQNLNDLRKRILMVVHTKQSKS